MLNQKDWLQRFREAGAVWNYASPGPHAVFEMAALHAGFYFNTGVAASDPVLVRDVAQHFADLCAERNIRPDWVVSYVANVANGLVFAARLAEILSARSGYVDLRRMLCCFEPRQDETVLIISDDIVSGGSLLKTMELIVASGGRILSPVLTLGNFFGQSTIGGREIASLFERKIEIWKPEDCPLCKNGSPPLKTRQDWQKLLGGA